MIAHWSFFEAKSLALVMLGGTLLNSLLTMALLRRRVAVGLDQPDGWRKQHEGGVSRLGGVPIFVVLAMGWLGASLWDWKSWAELMPLLVGNALVFSVGLLDDFQPMGAKVKLMGQVGAALLLYSMGVSIDVLSNPLGSGTLDLGWWSLLVTVLWLVAIPNVINLVDGMDGLAAGVGLFLSLTLAAVAHHNGHPEALWLALLMAGALCGFLFFNLPPARIFLGDGGAYLIGFFIASLSLKISQKGSVMAALLVVVIALGLPILDTAFVILRRAIRGVSIFSADADHIHHRLILLGYSKGRALLVMYGACLMLSLVGLSIMLSKGVLLPVVLASLILLALATARHLGYIRQWGALRVQFRQALGRRRRLAQLRAHALALELDLEQCESLEQFNELVAQRLGWLGLLASPPKPWTCVQLSGGRRAYFARQLPGAEGGRMELPGGEPFAEVLERALDRWGRLPCCVEAPDPVGD